MAKHGQVGGGAAALLLLLMTFSFSFSAGGMNMGTSSGEEKEDHFQLFSFIEPQPEPLPVPVPDQDFDHLHPSECMGKCRYRCSATSHKKPCMFFCIKCCSICLCVPPGTSGNKNLCPCYNNWITRDGRPKCP